MDAVPEQVARLDAAEGEKLSWGTVSGYTVGAFAQGLLPILIATQLLFYYCPPEGAAILALTTFGAIRIVERILGALIEPVVGHFSDRTRSRWGRRRPWMAFGLPFLCISFAAIWFPPRTDSTAAAIHFGVALMVFFASYTCVFAPYNALLPELSRDLRQRVRLSVWMALFEVLSNIVGAIASAPLLALGAVSVAGIAFANGHQVMGVGAAIIAFFAVVPVFLFTREVKQADDGDRQLPFLRAVKESLANRGFRAYAMVILGFRMAAAAAVMGVPFIGTQLMGLGNDEAQLMVAVIILVATFAFPLVQMLANKIGKAKVLRMGGLGFVCVLPLMGTIGLVSWLPVLAHGGVLFVLAGFSVATLFVLPRPILADVIDDDEKITGLRREAMYTGMSGVVEKLGEALAGGLVPLLFQTLGNSASHPLGLRLLGVLAASGIALGMIGFRSYSNRA